mmetsp:Transcript_64106/g.101717  ORF Transcript_64106/g.101717 Transcript_64106/m.101717 type:complete len:379 (-) Transcript_64106:2330-3466(-)
MTYCGVATSVTALAGFSWQSASRWKSCDQQGSETPAGEAYLNRVSRHERNPAKAATRLGDAHSTSSGRHGKLRSPSISLDFIASKTVSSILTNRTVSFAVEDSALQRRAKHPSRHAVTESRPLATRATKKAATTEGSVNDKQCPNDNSSTAVSDNHGASRNSLRARQISGNDSLRKRGAASSKSPTTASAAASPRTPSLPGCHAARARRASCHSDGSPPASRALSPAAAAVKSLFTRAFDVLGGLTKNDFCPEPSSMLESSPLLIQGIGVRNSLPTNTRSSVSCNSRMDGVVTGRRLEAAAVVAGGETSSSSASGNDGIFSAIGECQSADGTSDTRDGDNKRESPYKFGPANEQAELATPARCKAYALLARVFASSSL